MAKRDLKAFMRESAKQDEIVFATGPDTVKGDDGKPITLEIRVLNSAEIRKINDLYTKRTMATDKRGNPYIQNGEVAYKVETDIHRATGHLLAEALVYPDLKDPDLMKFFDCYDISEMAAKVFPRADEWSHVNRAVMAALGLNREPGSDDMESDINEAKN